MLTQLIYSSQPFGFDRSILAGILVAARRNNARDAITGALICRQDLYLQLIEGPSAAIETLFAKIGEDDRHQDVTVLHRAGVTGRMFPDWEMLDDPARSWLWSPQEVDAGVLTTVGAEAIEAVFARVAMETAPTR
jgi:hypothetical protein